MNDRYDVRVGDFLNLKLNSFVEPTEKSSRVYYYSMGGQNYVPSANTRPSNLLLLSHQKVSYTIFYTQPFDMC